MKLKDVCKLLDCQVLTGENKLDYVINKICASELMSNVLVCFSPNALLLTGLNNVQVVRTAEMSDIPAIVFVQDIKPTEEIINLAEESGIVIMVTRYSMFKACGILFQAGLRCGFDECS